MNGVAKGLGEAWRVIDRVRRRRRRPAGGRQIDAPNELAGREAVTVMRGRDAETERTRSGARLGAISVDGGVRGGNDHIAPRVRAAIRTGQRIDGDGPPHEHDQQRGDSGAHTESIDRRRRRG